MQPKSIPARHHSDDPTMDALEQVAAILVIVCLVIVGLALPYI